MKEINKLNNDTKTNKYKSKKQICILIFLWLFLLISFFRVPVIGVLIDSICFEFLFGYSKYIIYLLIFLGLILYKNKKAFYFLFSKRKLLIYILSTIFMCLLLSTINLYINHLENLKFSEFYLNNKYSYFSNWYNINIKNLTNIESYLLFNTYSWGGLIGIIFISFMNKYSFIIFLFIFLIILIISFLLIFNLKISKKFKNKMINKLGGFNSNQIKINIKEEINDLYIKNKEIILINSNLNKEQINFINDEIIITLNNLEQIKNIINIINKLKIENVKIIIDANKFK